MNEVLVVAGFWPTTQNPISGIFVVQQVQALCDAGVVVTVVAPRYILKRDRHLTPHELGLPSGLRFLSVSSFRLPESLSKTEIALSFNVFMVGASISFAIWRMYGSKRRLGGCIVHGLRYSGVSAPRWARKLAAKTLLFIHGVDPFLSHPLGAQWIRRLAPKIDSLVERVCLVGSPLRHHVEKIGLDVRNSVVIPNGTPIPSEEGRGHARKSSSPLTVVSVSNLVALKGIDDNIRALQILKEEYGLVAWEYEVIGDGPERTRLEDLVSSLGLQSQIRFLGRLPYKDTMEAVSRADIFSLPSWGEAFGIVYLEAMARYKPTIGCLANGAADIITDGEDGLLVPPKDPNTLALALKLLIENNELRLTMGTHARTTAESFTWDVNAARVLELLGLSESKLAGL